MERKSSGSKTPYMDPLVLGEGFVVDGAARKNLPNSNALVVGCSGTGKSLSVNYPTMLSMEESSLIATFAKGREARKMAAHFEKKGYKVLICDLAHPEKSNVSFDPLQHVCSYDDITDLANQSVMSVIEKTVDDYWQRKAVPVLGALIAAAMMTRDNATMTDVLELFDMMRLEERGYGVTTGADGFFSEIRRKAPNSYAVREFDSFAALPVKTANCVRDTLAACLSTMYPESLRDMMRSKKSISFEDLATERTALFIITSPVNTSLYCFANLMFATAIRSLLNYAEEQEDGRLPREVRLVFDDFAVSSKIHDFARHISIFRAAGVSALMLLQSETQLFSLYGEHDAQSIINNVSTYCYFSGGMDLTTCEHVAKRTNQSVASVLYSPIDRVYIMQAGRDPVVTRRYPIFQDSRYLELIGANASGGRECA